MHDPFSPFDKFSAKHPKKRFDRWHEPEICRVLQFARSFLYLKERRQSTTLNLKVVCIRNLVWVLKFVFHPRLVQFQSQRSPAARALKLSFLWWLVNWCYKLKGVTTTLRVWEAKWNHVTPFFVCHPLKRTLSNNMFKKAFNKNSFNTSWFLTVWNCVFHGFVTFLMVRHADNDMSPRCPVKCFRAILATALLITVQMLILFTWTDEKAAVCAQGTRPLSTHFYEFVFRQNWVPVLVLMFRRALPSWKK